MSVPLGSRVSHRGEPATSAAAVAPNDAADLPNGTTRALYIGGAGDVKVNMDDGSTVTFKAAPVGILPISVSRVFNTGTIATNILALY